MRRRPHAGNAEAAPSFLKLILLTLITGVLAIVLVTVVVFVCGIASDKDTWQDDVRDQQDSMLTGLAQAVALLHEAGHDVTMAELADYLQNPTHTSQSGHGDGGQTAVLDSADHANEGTLTLATYEWYRDFDDRVQWGRTCATVTLDKQHMTLFTADRNCPADTPKILATLPSSAPLGDWSTRTPLELAVAESHRARNAATLRRVLEHPELAGVAYGG